MKTDPIPTLRLGPFGAGMNTRRPDHQLDQYVAGVKSSFLRSIVNADLTAQGTLRRRQGYKKIASGNACRSLWSDGSVGYFADGANLKRIDETQAVTTLYSSLSPGAPVSFASTPLGVFYTDGVQLRKIDPQGVESLAGVPLFVAAPSVSAASGGSLPQGRYEVCFTYRRADGAESPSTLPLQVTVPEGGAINATGLPATWPQGVAELVIYVTAPDASTPMRARVLSAPSTTASLSVVPHSGARCATFMLAPMPAGHLVRYHDGRLLVAMGSLLFYSEPFALTLCNPSRGYIAFPAAIDIVESTGSGLYIIADKTYWLGADITTSALREALPYGAVRGTGGRSPDGTDCFWMSEKGFVKGNAEGTVANIQEDNVVVGRAREGAALFRQYDGMKQVLASLFGSEPSGFTARSYIDAEVIRAGTKL